MNSSKFFKVRTLFTILSIVLITACQNKSAKNNDMQSLFDGKTLNGWKIYSEDQTGKSLQPEFYVADGMIVCNTKPGTGGGFLMTEKSYANFILELDVKIDTILNSGIQCRGQIWQKDTVTTYLAGDAKGTINQRKSKAGYVWGYQIEVDPSSRAWSGGLYEQGNRGWLVTLANNEKARKAYKPMDWNHFKIIFDGNKIQAWVNGIQTVETTDNLTSSGFIGFQFHQAGEAANNKKSYWKNIKIKEL